MSKYISSLRRGDTKQITVRRSCKDSSGSPVPFLPCSTLSLSLKAEIDQPAPNLQIIHPVGSGPLDDLDVGICILSLPSNQNSGLRPGKYDRDIDLVVDTPFGLATTTLVHRRATGRVYRYRDQERGSEQSIQGREIIGNVAIWQAQYAAVQPSARRSALSISLLTLPAGLERLNGFCSACCILTESC